MDIYKDTTEKIRWTNACFKLLSTNIFTNCNQIEESQSETKLSPIGNNPRPLRKMGTRAVPGPWIGSTWVDSDWNFFPDYRGKRILVGFNQMFPVWIHPDIQENVI